MHHFIIAFSVIGLLGGEGGVKGLLPPLLLTVSAYSSSDWSNMDRVFGVGVKYGRSWLELVIGHIT